MNYDIIGNDYHNEVEDFEVMSIQDIINVCQKHKDSKVVFLGTNYTVGNLISWRGSYDTPCITYEAGSKIGAEIAVQLAEELDETHTGYKGGDYTYHPDDVPYISEYGNSEEYMVVGYEVDLDSGTLTLLTKVIPY